MRRPIIVVLLSGPPPVIIKAFWNTWNEPMIPVTSRKSVVGFTRGNTM